MVAGLGSIMVSTSACGADNRRSIRRQDTPYIRCGIYSIAMIAQLGERQTEDLKVARSIRAHGTNNKYTNSKSFLSHWKE